MTRHVAVYLRVSSRQQDTASQKPDLDRWVRGYADGRDVIYYEDSFSGKTMNRPAWTRLMKAVHAGDIEQIVVWRLDRLGRTAKGLTSLFDELPQRNVGLVSIKDGLDLNTAAGRLMANVLASVAQYETEIRAERVHAGQQRARAQGKTWGGSQPGRLLSLTSEQVEAILRLNDEGRPKAAIARATGVSRPTVYRVLQQNC
ncbi:recombinase family protein [Fuerstiella marisgermanici]|uniref:DNA-invertase hin n=1 Tax=Fuerstiella marisgermanici TaxID=1891926 RepID=A0A1P8WPA0_9PLAN|nr:recombinase family protein [Fuerstiella marisgermanici]APZ95883.1 DNA-invertase hin [Fuerstiella marisgermanici]